MRNKKIARRLAVPLLASLIGSLIVGVSSGPASADTVGFARGEAHGISTTLAATEDNMEAPEVESAVPGPADQQQIRTDSDRDILLDVLGLAQVSSVESDACLDEGVSAKLQLQANDARIRARGEEPADDDNDTNDGPNDEDPERTEVTPFPGEIDGCVRPGRSGPPVRSVPPSPTGTPTNGTPTTAGTPTPTPTAIPTSTTAATSTPAAAPVEAPIAMQTPTQSPTQSPGATATPTPTTTAPPPNCEDADTDPESDDFTGPTCLATLPLWNARGYANTTADTFFLGGDFQAEALARCENDRVDFQTAADYGLVGALMGADYTLGPNHQLDLIVAGGGIVTFWETNWDPETGATTDGSDTVWVNAAHIVTPAEDIIIGHAEATADCPAKPTPTPTVTVTAEDPDPQPTIPPGGFPRDISLNASKSVVLATKSFSLSGAVTPATEFETPRSCIENVTLTIRRDVIGGPQEFVDVGTVVTDVEGNFTFNYQADVNAQWIAFIDKNNPQDCALASSAARSVLVKPFVKLKLSSKTPRRGATVRMRAEVIPCLDHPGTRIKLKRSINGHLVEVETKALDGNCRAEFRIRANFKSAVYQASWPKQDEDHQTGQSRRKGIRTRGRR